MIDLWLTGRSDGRGCKAEEGALRESHQKVRQGQRQTEGRKQRSQARDDCY